ncbi:MAG: HAD family hydrolase [Spirochaetales bacterium]|nr:HAD family hydrolase [Spirochaetales bacterium]
MAYKAVCFDIDGTLYPIGIMNRRLLRIGMAHPLFNLRYRRNRKQLRLFQKDYRKAIPFRWREAMVIQNRTGAEPAGGFDEKDYRSTYGRLEKWVYRPMERLYRSTKPFDGVRETFEKIRLHGLKIGVFTDFPLFEKLKGMGIDDLVDFAASSDDAGFLKPDAHCFEYLLYNLKMDAKDVLYVGDSYSKDIMGASAAGLDAVLVNVRPSEMKDASGRFPLAKAVFRSWNDFDKWLTAILEDD